MKLFLLLPLLILPLALDAVHFAVKEKDRNIYCLILNANITGVLHYDNQKNTTSSVQFTVPSNEGASSPTQMDKDKSFCGPTVEKMQFDFLPDMVPPVPATEANQKWNIALEFTKNGTGPEQRYVLQSYALTVHYYTSMNASEKNDTIPHVYGQPEGHKAEWTAAANSAVPNGFSCSQNQLFLNQTDSSVTFKNIKLLAFAAQPFDNFTSTQVFEQCPLDVRTSDLVPIIVGICLAGLVIVVLIAYLIGRARAKRQGYASV